MTRILACLVALSLVSGVALGAPKKKKRTPPKASTKAPPKVKPGKKAVEAEKRKAKKPRKRKNALADPWKEPTYADSTQGDWIDGEDLTVRRAAVAALEPYNGSVVVADPNSGRVLSIVNQKLAFQSGFKPCSTIKVVAALAALREGIIEPKTRLRLSNLLSLNLTNALAHSNNSFFAALGTKLGFDRVVRYARLFGLGEKAGWNIEHEQPGVVPSAPPGDGVGKMTSFGSGFSMTPLELAGLLSAIANGGKLYYLQYPRTQEEVAEFTPRLKRELDIEPWIPDMKTAMRAVVDHGTGRRANYDPEAPVLGKTGTCTDARAPAHLGWFGSVNDEGDRKLVVVVLLTGGRPVSGPVAAGVAGNFYKHLGRQPLMARSSIVSTASCCAQ